MYPYTWQDGSRGNGLPWPMRWRVELFFKPLLKT
jgi:hypothetical protein